jgi:hypothetical protein
MRGEGGLKALQGREGVPTSTGWPQACGKCMERHTHRVAVTWNPTLPTPAPAPPPTAAGCSLLCSLSPKCSPFPSLPGPNCILLCIAVPAAALGCDCAVFLRPLAPPRGSGGSAEHAHHDMAPCLPSLSCCPALPPTSPPPLSCPWLSPHLLLLLVRLGLGSHECFLA